MYKMSACVVQMCVLCLQFLGEIRSIDGVFTYISHQCNKTIKLFPLHHVWAILLSRCLCVGGYWCDDVHQVDRLQQ